MEKYPGNRAGSFWYTYEGHIYYRDTREEGYYICAFRTSKARRCSTRAKLENGRLQIKRPHEHPKPCVRDKLTRAEIIKVLKQKARMSNKSPGKIYREVERSYKNRANNLITARSARSMVRDERNRIRPKIPSKFQDLEAMIRDNRLAEDILKGGVTAQDGNTAIIFASDNMIRHLNKATELFIDATFKSIPFKPRPKQLLIFHMKFKEKGIAAVYALCESKSKEVYDGIWEFLKQRLPELKTNLKSVMMDYENALINATKEAIPGITIRGCWFHYTMAIQRKWNNLGLQKQSRKILALAWGIPLLPAEKFSTAVKILSRANHLNKKSRAYFKLRQFIEYVENYWVKKGEKLSVYGVTDRTNNICESFHRQLHQHMETTYPNIFDFLDKLSDLIQDIDNDWLRLEDGQILTSSGQYKRRTKGEIEKQQKLLSEKRITVGLFLRKVTPFWMRAYVLPRSRKVQVKKGCIRKDAHQRHQSVPPRKRPPIDENQIRYKFARPLPSDDEVRYKLAPRRERPPTVKNQKQ